MPRFAAPMLLSAAIVAGTMSLAPQSADARSSRGAAGFVVGALVTGLIVNEIYRRDRRRHHYAYAPRHGYGYQPSYAYSYQPRYYHRPHYRYGW